MKRLLAYLFIVLGFGLTFSVSADDYPYGLSENKQYEYTTQFLKDGDYDGAEIAFKKFLEINPNHKLSGNAQYWLAETFRIRQLYKDAASNYLIGYEKYPKSTKAPINLLKLGVSMVQIGEKDLGCKMIVGMVLQYPKASGSVKEKAKYEAQKFKCDKRDTNYLAEIPKLLKKYDLEKKKETKKQELLLAQKKAEDEKKKQELLLVEERTKKLQDYDRFLAKKYQVQVNQKNIDLVKDYFRKGLSKKDIVIGKKSIVKINSKDVTTEDLVNYIDETGIQESQIKKNIDKNVIEDLLSGLITTKILDYEIEEYNLLIDDETLLEIIKKSEHFHDENGIFQRTKYEKFLLSNNISAKTFETQLRKRESEKRLFDLVVDGTIGSNKKYKVTKAKEPKQEEFKPENKDNEAPVIEIAEAITVNDSTYEIEGKVIDKSKKLFVQIDGETIPVKKGKFKIKRFSPVDEQLKIVALDQWGNKSKPKLVNITIDLKETELAEKLEQLNPSLIKSKSNKDRVALIIGIEKYEQTPAANFANLDAQYFYEYARKGFGISKSNIKLLVDEDADLIKSISSINKWLPSKIKKNKTELIIFFAGHGLASNNGQELYILPQDSDPDLLSRTALSRTELFEQIISLSPKSVTMFMDTCYSGISRDEKMLLASARPIRIIADDQDGIPNNFTIFSASKLDQISSGLKEAKHGIFSYYLMKGLEGKADINQDNKITNGELLAYMDQNVSQKASELGRQQNPSLAGDPNKVLMSYR